jgi:hypothetical protein
MVPAADGKTLTIKEIDGHLSVERVKVKNGTNLQWEGPAGTTAEVEFVDKSPFGSIKKVAQGQRLECAYEGKFPYRCSLRKDGKVVATGSPEHGKWGGEVEVTGKGGGRTP